MLDKKLDTFLKVAELGSFTRAADALFISPSAVIQQMNLLESDLGVKLMTRSRTGIRLTPAGELLRQNGSQITAQVSQLVAQLGELEARSLRELKVGTSLLNQCRYFHPLWNLFISKNSGYRATIQDIRSQQEWADVDLIEGPFNPQFLSANGMAFFQLTTTPIVCGMWKNHPLASRRLIRYADLDGVKLVDTQEGPDASEGMKRVLQEAVRHGAILVNVNPSNTSLFDTCILNRYIANIPQCWENIQSEFVTVPGEWDEQVPYGFFFKKEARSAAQAFLAFIKERKAVVKGLADGIQVLRETD